jgi:RISC-loading complex subunit TARBP2
VFLVDFFFVCTISTGTGKSKKLAKRQAAHKMWEKLQDSPITASSITPGLDDDEEVCAGILASPLVLII